jgi:hypothetical protein
MLALSSLSCLLPVSERKPLLSDWSHSSSVTPALSTEYAGREVRRQKLMCFQPIGLSKARQSRNAKFPLPACLDGLVMLVRCILLRKTMNLPQLFQPA